MKSTTTIATPATYIALALAGLTTIMLVIASVILTYVMNFDSSLSNDQAVWGQFGDYLGGVLNPILAFFSFLALLISLIVQARQAALAAEAFAQSKVESAQGAEDFSKGAELVESIAQSLASQSAAVHATAELLAISHALLSLDRDIREAEARAGLVVTEQMGMMRRQRDQLAARLLEVVPAPQVTMP